MKYYKNKIIFHHIPKTAGTTLISILDQHFDQSEIYPSGFFGVSEWDVRKEDIDNFLDKLNRFKLIHGHFPVQIFSDFSDNYFRFTIMREPKSRLISLYNDWRTKSQESLEKASEEDVWVANLAKTQGIKEFLSYKKYPLPALFDNGQVRLFSNSMDKQKIDNNDLKTAIDTINKMNFIGITEYFESSLSILCAKLNWVRPNRVENLNQRKKEGILINNFSNEELKVIHEYTKYDEVLYNYAVKKLDEECKNYLNNYNNNFYFEKNKIPMDNISLFMDKGFEGDGWHVREGIGSGIVWKWTGPNKQSFIKFYLKKQNYHLQMKIISVINQDILDNMDLYINSYAISWRYMGIINGQQIIEADINQKDLKNGENIFMIEVPYTISHFQVDNTVNDYRQKGIAVTEITMNKREL